MNWRAPVIRFFDQSIRRRNVHRYLALLRRIDRLPLEEQLRIQEQNLIELLRHAAEHVPYYSQILRDAGVYHSNGQIDLSQLTSIPLLSRSDLVTHFESLKSDDLKQRKWWYNSTGGSTGEPVRFIQDADYFDFSMATGLLEKEKLGYELGQQLVKLWGSAHDVLLGTIGWRAKMSGWLRNLTFLPCFCMSEQDKQRFIEILQRKQPVLLEAYADAAYELARFINKSDLAYKWKIKAVMTTAETLFPFMREEIEKAFSCPVFNRYGSREMGPIAMDTPSHDALGVSSLATHLVEILDPNGSPCSVGEKGEIVITSLKNYAMPLIRYRTGDRAVVGEHTDLPTASVTRIRALAGRISESFVKADGSIVSGLFFIHFLGVVHNKGWLRKFQVIQNDYDRITVRLVAETKPTNENLQEIERSVKLIMGDNCSVEFDFVDSIPALPSGKYCYTKSFIHRN